ncbi:bidirectional sugar transporter SWEET5-like [Hevea brasiliensis]|uniref:bidirectional sugar transporter SWEET5-like n=1 Tax=Hevea brasiliensis TaxID=3981 RepID=UPI0025E61786|nr:bidirectional sugar transporter SWEET5-like [Hevea brasiliensis]
MEGKDERRVWGMEKESIATTALSETEREGNGKGEKRPRGSNYDPTFVKIIKQKAVQDFKADPYVATVLNCAMWSFYGLPIVKEDSILVTTINAVGLLIELIYVCIFFIFSPNHKRVCYNCNIHTMETYTRNEVITITHMLCFYGHLQRRIAIALTVEVIFVAVVILISIVALSTPKKRAMFVGILCIILNIIMYVSPLTVMVRFLVCSACNIIHYYLVNKILFFLLQRMVIKTKSVKYMPFFLSLASLCNGIIWVVYALLKFDLNVVLPNGLGAISGLIQIILYAKYRKTTQWNDDDDPRNKPEVQLSSV